MASVIVGSGLFGFWGMLLAVPVFSTLYVLLTRHVNSRIAKVNKQDVLGAPPEDDIIKQQMPKDPREIKDSDVSGYVFNNQFIESIKTKVKAEAKKIKKENADEKSDKSDNGGE